MYMKLLYFFKNQFSCKSCFSGRKILHKRILQGKTPLSFFKINFNIKVPWTPQKNSEELTYIHGEMKVP